MNFKQPCMSNLFLVAPKAKAPKKEKVPRAPSAYNLFMKTELAKVKKADPKLDHKEAFTKAAANVIIFNIYIFSGKLLPPTQRTRNECVLFMLLILLSY